MSQLLAGEDAPTGVFVSNINQSIGALAAARQAGREMPGELSVVGYDDDPVGEYLDPPLTTIAMPLHELGSTAVDALIDRIQSGRTEDVVVPTPPRLVLRASTAPPHGAASRPAA
jgi:LacI family transcriptional regulator